MNRKPPPARRTSPLDSLLARLAAEAEGARFDPALPRRVEAAVRKAASERNPRAVPAWAAIAAAVLVALGVGTGSHAAGRATALPGACPAVCPATESPEPVPTNDDEAPETPEVPR